MNCKKKSISVVIVNWNAGQLLAECVDSVLVYGSGLIGKIIIVDNGSIDGSLELLPPVPNLLIIRTGKNLGFGKACNLGSKLSDSEYILFLNPDCRLFNNTLTQIEELINNKPEIGVYGVQLIDEQNKVAKSCARFPDLKCYIYQSLGLSRLAFFKKYDMHMSDWAHDQDCIVDHVIGAFYLIRASLYESVNGFDERFFVYLEDLDLSRRVVQAGYSIYYAASIQAFHAGGGTSRQVKAYRLFYSLRSRIQYAFKHFTTFSAICVLTVTILIEPISRIVLCAVRRDVQGISNTIKAYLLLLRDMPNFLTKGK
ncbi:MAG: glycosyltransferase family 2 protein [Aeromonas sobria]|uniref:glycosyltransferase family 2 protein n=1 Tax=Aeromonas sobria TaxID=646 RepID=UPI003F37BBB0